MIYFNYVLIFVAAALFFLLVILMTMKYLQEKLEFSKSRCYEELRRFIAPEKLLSLQVFCALITMSLFFIGQLLFGVEKMQIGNRKQHAFRLGFGAGSGIAE